MKLYNNGVYLINGTQIIEDSHEAAAAIEHATGRKVTKDEAHGQTMAYSILSDHNTSGNMDHLQIKFDKLVSHDITYVGIIQTARVIYLQFS